MPKYHVSPDGVPRICEADTKGCPLGSDAPHGDFSSVEEAQAFAERVNASRYGTGFGSMKRPSLNERGSEDDRRAVVQALSSKDQNPREDTVLNALKGALKGRPGMDVVNETFLERAYYTTASHNFGAEVKRVNLEVGEYVMDPNETDYTSKLNVEYAESVLSNRLSEFMGDGPWRVKINVRDYVEEE